MSSLLILLWTQLSQAFYSTIPPKQLLSRPPVISRSQCLALTPPSLLKYIFPWYNSLPNWVSFQILHLPYSVSILSLLIFPPSKWWVLQNSVLRALLYTVSLMQICAFKCPLHANDSRICISGLNSIPARSPFKRQIGTSNLPCPNHDLEFSLANLLLSLFSSSVTGSSLFPFAKDGDVLNFTLQLIPNFWSVSESYRLCLQNREREYKFFSSPLPLPPS